MESVQVTEAMKALREAVLTEVESKLPTAEHTIEVGGIVVGVSINPGAGSVVVKVKKWDSSSDNNFRKRGMA